MLEEYKLAEKNFKNPINIVEKFNSAVTYGREYLEYKEYGNETNMTNSLRNFGLDLGIASEWMAKYLVDKKCGGLSEEEKVSFLELWERLLNSDFKQELEGLGFKCERNKDKIYNKSIRNNIYNEAKHLASEDVEWNSAYDFYNELERIISNYVVNDRTGDIERLNTNEEDFETMFSEAEGFNNVSGYNYILLTDIHGLSENACRDLFRISWSMVVDMNPDYTEQGSIFYTYEHSDIRSDRFKENYTIRDTVNMHSKAVHWITVIEDKDKTDKSLSMAVKKNFPKFIESYRKYNHKPVIVVVAAQNKKYSQTIKSIIGNLGTEYYEEDNENGYPIKFLVLDNSSITLESDEDSIFNYSLNIRDFIKGINKKIAVKTKYQGEYLMPAKLDDETQNYISIEKDDYLRFCDFFEPVYIGIEEREEITNKPVDFYTGYSEITWKMLSESNVAIQQSVFQNWETYMKKLYNSGGNNNIKLFYARGMGGTTLLKQLAFKFHSNCPTIMLKKYVKVRTRDEILKLYRYCKKDILIFVDQNLIYDEDADNLAKELKAETCPSHIFCLKTYKKNKKSQNSNILPLENFDPKDSEFLLSYIKPYVKQTGLVAVEKEKSDIDSPFLMNMYAFEDEFQGIDRFVYNTLKNIDPDENKKQILFIIALAGWSGLNVEDNLFVDMYGKKITDALKRPEYELTPLIAYNDKTFRIRHYKFCESILKQMSGSKDNKISFFNLTTKIIDFIKNTRKDKDVTENDATVKLLERLFITRDWEVSDEDDHRSSYSPIIQKLLAEKPDKDDDRIIRIYETLIEYYPNEVHFYAHLARYYFYTAQNYTMGQKIIKEAMQIVQSKEKPDNYSISHLYHIQGIGYRTKIYKEYIQNIYADNGHIGDQRYNNSECISHIRTLLAGMNEDCRKAEFAFSASKEIGDNNGIYSLIAECQLYIRIQRVYNELKRTAEQFRIEDFVSQNDYIANQVLLQNKFEELDACSAFFELNEETDIAKNETTKQKIENIRTDVNDLIKEETEVIAYCEQCLSNENITNKTNYRKILAKRMYENIKNNILEEDSQKKLSEIIQLYKDNIEEEPYNSTYIRNWFNSVRQLDCDKDQAEKFLVNFEDTLSEWIENRKAPVEAYMYRYIVRFLRYFEKNSLSSAEAKNSLEQMMNEVKNKASSVIYKTNIIFWISNIGHGLRRLLDNRDFNKLFGKDKIETLQVFEGRLPNSESFGANKAYITIDSAYKVFFTPYKIKGKFSQNNAGSFVEFGMGFSYDGLRSYHDSIKKVAPKSLPRNHYTSEKVYMTVVKHNKFWVEGLIQDDETQPVIINKNDLVPIYNPDENRWPEKDEVLYVQLQAQKDYILRGEEYSKEMSLKKTFQATLCSNE